MNQKRQRSGKGRTVAAFALGATAGSILALLFAPTSGRVTRKRLVQEIGKLRKSATRKLGETTKLLATKVENAREVATDWISQHVTNGKHQPIRRRPVRHA